jgi:hypothetical protein
MKTLKPILALLLITFIFSSCDNKTGISLTKRRYNKGYYVAHKGKPGKIKENQIAAAPEKTNKIVATKAVVSESPLNETGSLTASNVSSPKEPIIKKGKYPSYRALQYHTKAEKTERVTIATRIKKSMGLKSSAPDSADDTLSLLWIVILIILALYVLALLTGGWGLGGLIHILGVVALVLLILWLLKVL